MRKIWPLLLILFFYSPNAYAQSSNAIYSRIIGVQFSSTPTGGCSAGQVAIDSANGVISPCIAGAWVTPSGGGGFTAAGDLSGNGTSQTVIGINNTLLSGLATGIPLLTAGVPSIISPTNCTTNWGQGINASGNEQCTSSVTGNITVGSLATNSDGVHPSSVQLVGNTTLPSLTGNTVTLLGFPAATNTAWSFQFPTAIPANGHVLGCTVSGTNCLLTDEGAPGTGTVGGTATVGFLPMMVTNTSTITSSLCDQAITTANTLTCTDTAGLAVPKVTTTGTTAGFMDFPQGSTSAAVAPCNTATSICEQAPTAVTSYLLNKPGAAPDISSYKQTDGCGSAICTESFHPVPVLLTVASDFTDSTSTSLQLVTGLSTTMPVSKAVVISGHCGLLFDQATAAVSDSIGIGVTGTAPSSANASATSYTSASVTATGTLVSLASTTPTAVVTFTPSAITTVWKAEVDFTVEQPSNATPGIFGIYVSTTTGTDNLIVKRGSYCSVTYQ